MDYLELAKELFHLRFAAAGAANSVNATKGEDGVLLWLYLGKEETIAGDLAEALGLTSGRIANILKQLEAKKFVTRKTGKDDKRKVVVVLTKAGREHISTVYQNNLQQVAGVLEQLGEKDAEEYLRIRRRLSEIRKAASGN